MKFLVKAAFIFVVFATSNALAGSSACKIGGCSGELCVKNSPSENTMSICLWKEEFSCYKLSKCELQKDRKCGWTKTPEFISCLKSSK